MLSEVHRKPISSQGRIYCWNTGALSSPSTQKIFHWIWQAHIQDYKYEYIIHALTPNTLVAFSFSGFKFNYVHEWDKVYYIICKYVSDTYLKRMEEKQAHETK